MVSLMAFCVMTSVILQPNQLLAVTFSQQPWRLLLICWQCSNALTAITSMGINGVGRNVHNTPGKCMLLTVSGFDMKTATLDTTKSDTFIV
jgi:hypothetical protein